MANGRENRLCTTLGSSGIYGRLRAEQLKWWVCNLAGAADFPAAGASSQERLDTAKDVFGCGITLAKVDFIPEARGTDAYGVWFENRSWTVGDRVVVGLLQ